MYFKINGVNILPYVTEGGIKYSRNDVEADDAGRTMDALMHRGRVAIKDRVDITCMPLTQSATQTIMGLILPEYVTVEWDFHPIYGTVTKTYYSNNVPATCATIYEDGTALWDEITFPLVER